MEHFKPLSVFFETIAKDGRISVTHIGVYAVLLNRWQAQEFKNPVMAFSHDLMSMAKISTRVTLLKCIHDLKRGGYIHYEPSLKRNIQSKIYLIF